MHLLRPHRRTPSSSTASLQTQPPSTAPAEITQLPTIETSPPNFLGGEVLSGLSPSGSAPWTNGAGVPIDDRPSPVPTKGSPSSKRRKDAKGKELDILQAVELQQLQQQEQHQNQAAAPSTVSTTSRLLRRGSSSGRKAADASFSSVSTSTTTFGPSSSATSHKKHNAKSLLHPMSLLLRRRSAQANNVIDSSTSVHSSYSLAHHKFGPNKDLPDDFDPGIIYGTRQHDWSSPRNKEPLNSSVFVNLSRPGAKSNTTTLSGEVDNGTVARDHAPMFREHFGDDEIVNDDILSNTGPRSERHSIDHSSISQIPSTDFASGSLFSGSGTIELPASSAVNGAQAELYRQRVVDQPSRAPPPPPSNGIKFPPGLAPPPGFSHLPGLAVFEETEMEGGHEAKGLDDTTTPIIHMLENTSRFSFEASSTADSSNLDDQPSEEILAVVGRHAHGSHVPDNMHHDSTYSDEDSDDVDYDALVDEDDDDDDALFQPPSDLADRMYSLQSDANLPLSMLRATEDLTLQSMKQVQMQDLSSPRPEFHRDDDETSSNQAESQSSLKSFENAVPIYPPFMNPISGSVGLIGQEVQQFYAPDGSRLDHFGNTLNSGDMTHALPFNNIYQTPTVGVSEQESLAQYAFTNPYGSASAFAIDENYGEFDDGLDYDAADDDDGDLDMIEEANRVALANDNEGWYSREFGNEFYDDLPRPGFAGKDSLTPISERSESSFRNSLIVPNGVAFPGGHGGVGAISLSAALSAQLSHTGHPIDETIVVGSPTSAFLPPVARPTS